MRLLRCDGSRGFCILLFMGRELVFVWFLSLFTKGLEVEVHGSISEHRQMLTDSLFDSDGAGGFPGIHHGKCKYHDYRHPHSHLLKRQKVERFDLRCKRFRARDMAVETKRFNESMAT